MIFKIRTSVLLLAASLSLSGMAGAGLIARESFDYPIGAVVSADGGAGWDGAWRDSTGATASIAVASGLGHVKYYAADPFHEGGDTTGITLATASQSILAGINKANPPTPFFPPYGPANGFFNGHPPQKQTPWRQPKP